MAINVQSSLTPDPSRKYFENPTLIEWSIVNIFPALLSINYGSPLIWCISSQLLISAPGSFSSREKYLLVDEVIVQYIYNLFIITEITSSNIKKCNSHCHNNQCNILSNMHNDSIHICNICTGSSTCIVGSNIGSGRFCMCFCNNNPLSRPLQYKFMVSMW